MKFPKFRCSCFCWAKILVLLTLLQCSADSLSLSCSDHILKILCPNHLMGEMKWFSFLDLLSVTTTPPWHTLQSFLQIKTNQLSLPVTCRHSLGRWYDIVTTVTTHGCAVGTRSVQQLTDTSSTCILIAGSSNLTVWMNNCTSREVDIHDRIDFFDR